MNLTYLRLDVWRSLRNFPEIFFIAILPLFFYLIFGTQSYGTQTVGRGNVNMMIMVTMAMYGAVIATANVGSSTAVETTGGWGRQLALTPFGDVRYLVAKLAKALVISAIPVVLIFGMGLALGAKAPLWVWGASAGFIVLGSIMFAFYGSIFGLALSPKAAGSAASGGMVVLAFLGNMFFPLSGGMLQVARFTPLYGLVSLVRRPVSEGYIQDGTTFVHEPLWMAVTSVVAWTLIFAVVTWLLARRSKARR